MTNTEFSIEFDVLYNNIMSNQAPGLDEYEKSVFLTKAQDEILKSYFINIKNKSLAGFDGNEKRQIDFSSIIYKSVNTNPISKEEDQCQFELPKNAMFILNEYLNYGDTKLKSLVVIPITYTDLDTYLAKPYPYPPKNQAWRIIENQDNNSCIARIFYAPLKKDLIKSYIVRYIKRPYPIILTTLENGLSIEGETMIGDYNGSPCQLDINLHSEILQRAVELAKASYTENLANQIALSNNSQTDIGIRNISNNDN
jgi:hypothetical protein